MSARAKLDPQVAAHIEWLGYIQPTGLVVSAPALVRAGAILDRRDAEGQRLLRSCVEEREFRPDEGPSPWLPDFRTFATTVLGWNFSPSGYSWSTDGSSTPELDVTLTDYDETLRWDVAVRELDPQDGSVPWQLLVRILEPGQDFDHVFRGGGGLEVSAHGRMERLLRQTGVPAGLLFNGCALRVVSAPRGESSGWMDFSVADMVVTPGRPICTALRLLLGQSRLLSLPRHQRLAALLEDSRKYQNEVSERLADQVLHALYELLRGFQAAHDASDGQLLKEPLRSKETSTEVYHALLTVLLRLVFLLYAEERDMLPEDEIFLRHYSLAGLYERLREDASLFPDTMDQRYGAWAQLLVLFRMIDNGARFGSTVLPQRHGVLFDPDRFPFLEGRAAAGGWQIGERHEAPLVPDGTIYRALEYLMLLDGERISYRALDVEEIGSVYETMMGFKLERATGRSIAIKSQKKQGAPTTVDLDALLNEEPAKRKKWFEARADRTLTDRVAKAVKEADTLEDLHAALWPVIELHATPDLVPLEAMVLQPSEERRRSGSHYTPRSLTEPIVRTTLEPVLASLRGQDDLPPTPDQILDVRVCDPAMGSGAFLVESCRQLGDALIEAWNAHGGRPDMPQDEDEVVFARRSVAQRCLYGVDRNPVAVDLAKVSLWLATLARDHALTFVDHALRHGDSLVGLTLAQIEALRWDNKGRAFESLRVGQHLERVGGLRERIRFADDTVADGDLRRWWREADDETDRVRIIGDLVIAAYFLGTNAKEREEKRVLFANAVRVGEVEDHRGWLDELRHGERPLVPFHWELEFPEVFERSNPGFDVIVGNPPFQGGRNLSASQGEVYVRWLLQLHEETTGGADLVAHFFRRAFVQLRTGGAFGLIATNSIAQGDTRASGLQWICIHLGEIFRVRKRVKWPGAAAVIVSVVHVMKGPYRGERLLDGRQVARITAFLVHAGPHTNPARLLENKGRSYQGSIVLGSGFTFDDNDTKRLASSLSTMCELIEGNPRNGERIFPYLGGDEINSSPSLEYHRYVIDFREMDEAEAREWPDLMRILEERVKPQRESSSKEIAAWPWWRHWRPRRDLYGAIEGLERVLVTAQVSQHFGFVFQPTNRVFAMMLNVFIVQSWAEFCALQARPHEIWARFFGSSLEDRLRYTPSDCFETFPFPEGWQEHPVLEPIGRTYYALRAELMVRNDEGLTKTYNRFHNPDERDPDVVRLRGLHAAMDRAVLDAYGWSDISTDCEFILDYEIDEEEWGRKKKPYRYRWPDDVRDEVLARLLELNARRAEEEARVGASQPKKRGGTAPSEGSLF